MNYKEQIYHRIELLDYFISKLTGNTLSDKSIGIMINVLKATLFSNLPSAKLELSADNKGIFVKTSGLSNIL